MTDLKPCPSYWCSKNAELETHREPFFHTWAVTCPECHIRGPIGATEAEAIEAWNTRVTDRDAVLEEAAKVADEIADQQRKMKARGAISVEASDESIGSCEDIAAAIRAMKGGEG